MAIACLLVSVLVLSVASGTQPARVSESVVQCPNDLPSSNLNKFILVLSAEMLPPDSGGSTLRFRPMTVWKSPIHADYSVVRPQAPLKLRAPLKLEAAQKYLLYLTRSQFTEELEIAECSRTKPLETAREDLAVLGEGVNAADYLRLIAEEDAFPQVTTTSTSTDTDRGRLIESFASLRISRSRLKQPDRGVARSLRSRISAWTPGT